VAVEVGGGSIVGKLVGVRVIFGAGLAGSTRAGVNWTVGRMVGWAQNSEHSRPAISSATYRTVPAFLISKTRFILFSNTLSNRVTHNQAPSKQFLGPVPKAIRIIPGGGLRIQNYLGKPRFYLSLISIFSDRFIAGIIRLSGVFRLFLLAQTIN
jgi:hypothetical protein